MADDEDDDMGLALSDDFESSFLEWGQNYQQEADKELQKGATCKEKENDRYTEKINALDSLSKRHFEDSGTPPPAGSLNANPLIRGGSAGLQSLPSFPIIGDATSGITSAEPGAAPASMSAAQLMAGFPPFALMPLTGTLGAWPMPMDLNGANSQGNGANWQGNPATIALPQHLASQRNIGAGSAPSSQTDSIGVTAVTASTATDDASATQTNKTPGCLNSGGAGSSSSSSQNSSASNQPPLIFFQFQQLPNQHNQSQTAPIQQPQRSTPQLHPLGIQSSASCPQYIAGQNPFPGIQPVFPAHLNNVLPAGPFPPNQDLHSFLQMMERQLLSSSGIQPVAPPSEGPQRDVPQPTMPSHSPHAAACVSKPQPQPTVPASGTKKATKASKKVAASSSEPSGPLLPPFHLFDAPVELRQNFLQSQRMHNLPIRQDDNSVHYGMAVNGFHPQVNAQENRIHPVSSDSRNMDANVKLVDSRHKRKGAGRGRNEREQRRAQKITELIDQLRLSMEDAGWKVETRSKYHTLSTCADYVKHLVKANKEKEAAVEKARSDLEARERKLEEDKASAESRSDPESVTSSLTTSSHGGEPAQPTKSSKDSATDDKKRKAVPRPCKEDSDDFPAIKKARMEKETDGALSSLESSRGLDDKGCYGVRNISLGKMSSTMSDITDSNRGSSDSGGDKNSSSTKNANSRSDNDESSTTPSSSSISSTAVVVRGEGSNSKHHGHADVVIKEKKRKHRERTSLEKNFEVDFEEVFVSSNIPQLIATTAGRIITCNDFFLKATGLTRQEVSRLTIFSIVQADRLANLFEMVAEALHESSSKSSITPTTSTTSSSGHTTASASDGPTDTDSGEKATSSACRYASMTLPCISFPAGAARRSVATSHHPNPLYMTVTLMPDADPRKRCFHCMLTDSPGTDEALGFITPELLALLFND